MTKAEQKEREGRERTILVVEDDRSLREGLAMNFRLQGHRVVTAANGDDGMRMAFDEHPDLIVLDIMLPGWSGLEILGEIRAKAGDVPVLILSARGKTEHKLEGFGLGADDYVAKPFELPELLARAEALLRRARRTAEPPIRFGDVEVDPIRRTLIVRGEPVALSARELDLLLLLARSPGRPLTRETILDRIWGWGFEGTERTVDNFIMALRQKIEVDPSRPRHLITVRQVGYKLEF
jgi:DNA-binding response OmpR family regulator